MTPVTLENASSVHGYKLSTWCVAHLGALVDTLLFFMMQQVVRDAVMITIIRAAIATITPTTMPSMLTGGLGRGTVKEQANTAEWGRMWKQPAFLSSY